MINDKKVLAIIPARGGSKGLPGKNVRCLGGLPLIASSINAARSSGCVDRIIVSTDSDEIANIAREYGAEAPFKRPAQFATDTSPSSELILHALQWVMENERTIYDIFCLLQPTSPFRNGKHLVEAITKFHNCKEATSLISISETTRSPYWMKKINGVYLEELINGDYSTVRRQDLPKTYSVNGAIYIMYTEEFLKTKRFLTDRTTYYLMDSVSSLDIDNELDFKFAEFLLNNGSVNLA